MHFWAASLTLCSFAFALSACEARVTKRHLEVVHRKFERATEQARQGQREGNLSRKEVESILGQPKHVDPPEMSKKDADVVRYTYEVEGENVDLYFFDNRLFRIKTASEASDEADMARRSGELKMEMEKAAAPESTAKPEPKEVHS